MELSSIQAEHTSIDEKLFEKICFQIEHCRDSTRLICEKNGISDVLFEQYLNASPANVSRYAQAKEKQAEWMLDEIHVIEDKLDTELTKNDPKIANAIATSYRMKIDNIKWILSKLKPKKYGDSIKVENRVVSESVMVCSDAGKELFELKESQKDEQTTTDKSTPEQEPKRA